jgi:hypothetical protein
MVQMQTNNSQGFCLRTEKVKSLYILSADSHQFYGQGMIDVETYLPNITGLANYTICMEANSDIFLSEFLNKINSEKFYSCERQYNQRFDIKLQRCMLEFENAGQQTNMARTSHILSPSFLCIFFCTLLILQIERIMFKNDN